MGWEPDTQSNRGVVNCSDGRREGLSTASAVPVISQGKSGLDIQAWHIRAGLFLSQVGAEHVSIYSVTKTSANWY